MDEKFKDELELKRTIIEIEASKNPTDFWTYLAPHFKQNMFLLCALDEAYNDLFTKLKVEIQSYILNSITITESKDFVEQ